MFSVVMFVIVAVLRYDREQQTWDFPQILTNKPPKLIYNSVII